MTTQPIRIVGPGEGGAPMRLIGSTGESVASAEQLGFNVIPTEWHPVARESATSSATYLSGQLRLSYFTAGFSGTSTGARLATAATAAAATPTLIRFGLYTVAADGGLSALVAATPNDTTLFAATFTSYAKAWSTPYALVQGQRYAAGVLTVSAAAMPALFCQSLPNSEARRPPAIGGFLAGLSDLPASVPAASFSDCASRPFIAITP